MNSPDDVYFEQSFGNDLDRIWDQFFKLQEDSSSFDILFLSFQEVDLGADKVQVTENLFKLWSGNLNSYYL